MLFTRDGRYITDVRVNSTRSWILNGIGQADFNMAVTDPKCTRTNLEFGNLLLIRHETLPDWIGVIDVPRPWQNNQVSVRAYEIMKINQWRRTPDKKTLKGTAGNIAQQLVALGNAAAPMQIRMDVVTGVGTSMNLVVGDTVAVHLNQIRQAGNHDMITTIGWSGNRLIANIEWLAHAGVNEIPPMALVEGKNIENGNVTLTEDSDFVNDLLGQSDASAAGSRLQSRAIDQVSIDRYGRRQGKTIYSNIKDQGSLDALVAKDIATMSTPRRIASLVALNVGDTFKYLRLGVKFDCRLTTAGFIGDVPGNQLPTRIYGMRYTDGTGRCEIMNKDTANGQF